VSSKSSPKSVTQIEPSNDVSSANVSSIALTADSSPVRKHGVAPVDPGSSRNDRVQ
jgi:hypothetical protein